METTALSPPILECQDLSYETKRQGQLSHQIDVCQRSLADRGRVLFRYSGTENLARIMIEGENLEEIEQMAKELVVLTDKSIEEYLRENAQHSEP